MRRHGRNYDYGFPQYVTVGEKQARNRKAIEKLRKRNPNVQPVVIDGRSIARTWWGKSWNQNLERYADYRNRIERGRSYVRHGAVLDLQIEEGQVAAVVQGSRSKPYTVTVEIKALPQKTWKALREESTRHLDCLTDLLGGTFPKALKDAFFAQGTGLFPSPKEISFDCSCPDWASMCKHVAATLYGIGNRLDTAPELLFALRQVSTDELITQTIDTTTKNLVERAEQATGNDVLADADLGDVFGIEMDLGSLEPAAPLPKPPKKTKARKTRTKAGNPKAPAKKTKRKRPKSGSRKRAAADRHPERGEMIDQLVAVLDSSRRRFTAAKLHDGLPAWSRSQVANTLQRAIAAGRIERVERGIYRLA